MKSSKEHSRQRAGRNIANIYREQEETLFRSIKSRKEHRYKEQEGTLFRYKEQEVTQFRYIKSRKEHFR